VTVVVTLITPQQRISGPPSGYGEAVGHRSINSHSAHTKPLRQPSRGGTSRMMREYHVRICEELGVQFPGSTRQSLLPRSGTHVRIRQLRTITASEAPPGLAADAGRAPLTQLI
jgi:hypothetical protein